MNLTQKQTDLFWSKVDIQGPDECWNWKAGKSGSGYGQVDINGKKLKAHRVAFLLYYGHFPMPMGLHSCDNPICCNPNHIHEGTNQDNVDEKMERGRHLVGEQSPTSKLTAEQAREIESMPGKYREIAKQFGITSSQVSEIKNHHWWKHLW